MLVISRHSEMQKNLKALREAPEILQGILQAMSEFERVNGLPLLDIGGSDLNSFLASFRTCVPNCDYRGFDFLIDLENDVDELIVKTKERLFNHFNGIIGGIRITKEAFMNTVSIDSQLIRTLVCKRRELDRLESGLTVLAYRKFISIHGDGVEVGQDSEEALSSLMTTYATPRQSEAFQKFDSTIRELVRLEMEYQCPGLVTNAIAFDEKCLTKIK